MPATGFQAFEIARLAQGEYARDLRTKAEAQAVPVFERISNEHQFIDAIEIGWAPTLSAPRSVLEGETVAALLWRETSRR